MADEENQTIIKKVYKIEGGHHGGAWKVAYADFVTAMMAFFLLLWLLNVTTDEQKHGIAEYFSPSTASRSSSGSGGVMGGTTLSPDGAMTDSAAPPTVVVELTPPKTRVVGESEQEVKQELEEEELLKQIQEREQRAFDKAEAELQGIMESSPNLEELKDHLIIDNTPEGLRIQIVDQQGRSLFPPGKSNLLRHAKELLGAVAKVVEKLPNQLSVTGHTDSTPFRSGTGEYTNWELSADRASASRRGLLEAGVLPARFARVSGIADTEPLIEADPNHPNNRRIAIVLIREAPVVPPSLKKEKTTP